ncbi:MAG TPA: hypothetical protein DCE42_19670 [Myxococcales bacterium]|nr:hypothetical protein [Deltaproteobacteria bacterium]MBU52127.1 hypothetical protein [Deltaproteobacteria bacterium]HAA56995.1 hypothetical protein [Myxococcales bacterium]
MTCLLMPAYGWSGEKACKKLYHNNQFVKAGRCFLQLTQQVSKHLSWKEKKAFYKDRFLSNAAACFVKRAGQVTRPEVQRYWKERAADLLTISFDKKYCMATSSCRVRRTKAEALMKEVRKTPLSILTGVQGAVITLKGFRFRSQKRYELHNTLRPGPYTVHITYPKKTPFTKKIQLLAGRPLTLNLTPAKIRIVKRKILLAKKVPAFVIVGYVVGGIALTVGGGLAIYGGTRQSEINAIVSDPNRQRELPPAVAKSEFEQARSITTIGFVVMSMGVLTLAGAGLTHFLTERAYAGNKAPKSPPHPRREPAGSILVRY